MSPERFVHYRLGNQEIDDSHFELLTNLHNLTSRLKHDIRIVELDSKTMDMIQIVILLFEKELVIEETIMEYMDYPYRKFHEAIHLTIRNCLTDLIDNFKNFNYFKLIGAATHLDSLFIDHIDIYDRQFYTWLEERKK